MDRRADRLIASYRLQLNDGFTLHDARERVPYLAALGISHLYLSPVLAARRGSTHGYDVSDPTHVSESLGGEAALEKLASVVQAHGMGILLDIVPNHMGIGPENPFWDDLLRFGQDSRFAEWFDVAWRAPTRRLEGKVLVPVLGDTLKHALERDELSLDLVDDAVRVRYFENHFPLDPRSLPDDLSHADVEFVRGWANGEAGRRRLRSLLAKQHYELAFWRTAQRDLNYRRFFDVNELISLRVEREDVFVATHRKVLDLVERGLVDGLRVDHIDGLLEPRGYLERLRKALDGSVDRHIPIVVEKILAHGESLPDDWPVDGTTGYEFLVTLEDLFINPEGAAAIEAAYRGGRERRGFNRISVASKRRVLRSALNADVRRLAPMLSAVARLSGWPRRSIAAYANVIVEFVAALPVYRTYVDSVSGRANARDRALMEATLLEARARTTLDAEALKALEKVLLDDWSGAELRVARARLAFVLRLQQLSGPAAAKGVEDTALYQYAPLGSRCEVGSDPAVPVQGALDRFVERLEERVTRFPRSLNATNTHDTKRSADARARIDALSEHPAQWRRALSRWRKSHRAFKTRHGARVVPTPPVDDFIYQSLLAIWPLMPESQDADAWHAELSRRLTEYLIKAGREAKVDTSWTDPDAAYEAAIGQFVEALMDGQRSVAFHEDMSRFVAGLAPSALATMLGRVVLHLLSPGVPDVYQGDELWYAALVDPDNRRPVDWGERADTLASLPPSSSSDRCEWLRKMRDEHRAGELKMLILRDLLSLRRDLGGLEDASFQMLSAEGSFGGHVFAFHRKLADGREMIVCVARNTVSLPSPQQAKSWEGTWLRTAGGASSWRRVIHGGDPLAASDRIVLSDLFRALPVEVLVGISSVEQAAIAV